MSQRESPITDRGTRYEPLLSTSTVSPRPHSLVPLDATMRQLLRLPSATGLEGSEPAQVPLRQILDQLHAGQSLSLPTYTLPESDTVAPTAEEAQQCEAVARALATPDLFLIQGSAGTGKSHVASRILREAVGRGWRVLFLATTSAALDQALCRALEQTDFPVARCLHEGETLDALPPCVRRTTLDERVRQFNEQTLHPAQTEARNRSEIQAVLENHHTILKDLADSLRRDAEVTTCLDSVATRLAQLPATVEGETGPEELATYWAELARVRAEVARQQTELHEHMAECQQREQSQREEIDRLKPLVEARQGNRWWSPNYWRSSGKGDVQNQTQTLEQSCQELRATALQTQQTVEQLHARLEGQTQATKDALDQLRADLDTQVQRHLGEQRANQERWHDLRAALPEELRPTERTQAALAQSRQRLVDWIERARTEAEQAEKQRAELEQASIGLRERLAHALPVVAATIDAFTRDPDHGTEAQPADYDLLLLEESERVTEADLLAVAGRAHRWVLIGESSLVPESVNGRPGRGPGKRLPQAVHLRPGLFHRLWAELHDDPSTRPVAWRQDLDRLVCVLSTVPPDQERWIQPEPVVDHPEITLHIWSQPRQSPRLVEVEFPAGTSIEDAKTFVLRELDELPLQTRARGVCWEDTSTHIIAHLGGELPGKSCRVGLGEGIFEEVHLLAGHWQTDRLEFERPTWTRTSAVAWLRRSLGFAGQERTLLLDRARRASPALAGWLADLLTDGFRPASVPTPCVDFVTVPSLSDDRPGRRHEPVSRNGGVATLAPKLKTLRGGAGVEIDLAEPRRHDLLPRELREILPEQGLVNYLEAQAAVRLVRELIDDPQAQAEILEWQDSHQGTNPGIAVLALYPAQAQLIRYLLETVPLGAIRVEVATPDQMRHRECAVAVVSLTRSHLHRPVTYGENPSQLTLALTRPSRRLILMGDPGTLLRRSQCATPVDHLDEAESEQEQTFASRLVRYLQGHGSQQRAFTIRELSGL